MARSWSRPSPPTTAATIAPVTDNDPGATVPPRSQLDLASEAEVSTRHGMVLSTRCCLVHDPARFGTAADVTLAELSVESFFPADEATREAVGSLR